MTPQQHCVAKFVRQAPDGVRPGGLAVVVVAGGDPDAQRPAEGVAPGDAHRQGWRPDAAGIVRQPDAFAPLVPPLEPRAVVGRVPEVDRLAQAGCQVDVPADGVRAAHRHGPARPVGDPPREPRRDERAGQGHQVGERRRIHRATGQRRRRLEARRRGHGQAQPARGPGGQDQRVVRCVDQGPAVGPAGDLEGRVAAGADVRGEPGPVRGAVVHLQAILQVDVQRTENLESGRLRFGGAACEQDQQRDLRPATDHGATCLRKGAWPSVARPGPAGGRQAENSRGPQPAANGMLRSAIGPGGRAAALTTPVATRQANG